LFLLRWGEFTNYCAQGKPKTHHANKTQEKQ